MARTMPRPFSPQPWWARASWALLASILAYALIATPSIVGRWGAAPAGVALAAMWVAACGLAWIAAERRALVPAVLAVTLAGRIAAAWLSSGRVSPGDPHSYLLLAAHLRAGTGLWIDEPFMGLRAWALYPPVYPLLLAGWSWAFGVGAASLIALSGLLDLASAVTLAAIGRAIGAPLAGRRAALLLLLWPAAWFDAPLAQKESLAVLLVLVLARLWLAPRPPAVAIGVAGGLLALTQPGWAPIAGLFGLALGARLGMVALVRRGALAGAVAAAVLLPWWLRNAVLFGAFVPLTSAGGVSLWIGNHAGASGLWGPEPPGWRGLGELAYAARAAAAAKAWIVAHPLGFVALNLAKFLRALGAGDFALVRLAAMRPPLLAASAALWLPLLQGAQLLLWAASLVTPRRREDRAGHTALLLVAAGFAQLLLFGVWFEFGERHRVFLTPLLLLLVAARGSRTGADVAARQAATAQRALVAA